MRNLFALLVLLATACPALAQSYTTTPSSTPTPTATPTGTLPTATATPTETSTPVPTDTPTITPTPVDTNTPTVTPTPTSPAPTPFCTESGHVVGGKRWSSKTLADGNDHALVDDSSNENTRIVISDLIVSATGTATVLISSGGATMHELEVAAGPPVHLQPGGMCGRTDHGIVGKRTAGTGEVNLTIGHEVISDQKP